MSKRRMDARHLRLLSPASLAKIQRLELLARGVVQGFVPGKHRSPYKGFSVEFAEHRQYVPGDDIADLDWRVLARSDRYYVKEYVEETNLRATILIDASGSMAYTGKAAAAYDANGGAPQKLSKFQYAQYLAACLAHLLIRQADAVGLVTFDTKIRRYVPARARASHLRVILEELADTEPGGETALAPIFHDIAERVHRRGLIIILSDLFDDVEPLLHSLHHFRYRKHEVIVLNVMAEEEMSFPFARFTEFRDLEVHGHVLQIDPRSLRAAYLQRVREHIRRLELGCGQMRTDYAGLITSHPFDETLAAYLARRRAYGA